MWVVAASLHRNVHVLTENRPNFHKVFQTTKSALFLVLVLYSCIGHSEFLVNHTANRSLWSKPSTI